ncbi:MAG: Hint domain-containing protein, partial [bacterium]
VSATGEHPFLVARAGPRAAALDTRADPEAVALVEPLDTRDRTGQDRAGQDRTGHGRWVPASDLDEGDAVRTMSPQGVAGTATVTKIRSRHAVVPVYNLTVQGTSRYLVGACGVVVHNTGCGMGGAEGGRNWRLGDHKTALKWERQMKERGWTAEQITEALETAGIPVRNAVNPANPATRHVHPTTGRSVVIDSQTGQVLQLGGDGFRFSDWDL